MLAERRDFIVATNSSTFGTGDRLMISVLTGSGCGAGCFASVLLHPQLITVARHRRLTIGMSTSFLNELPLKLSCQIQMLPPRRKIHGVPSKPLSHMGTKSDDELTVFGPLSILIVECGIDLGYRNKRSDSFLP